MPQLDFIIVFPQIFWLFISFFFLYTITIHSFLPLFIKILKTRKKVLEKNLEILSILEKKYDEKQTYLNSLLNENFLKIKVLLEKNIFSIFFQNKNFNLEMLDKKIMLVLYHNILYYDINILESVELKPKSLNFKKG